MLLSHDDACEHIHLEDADLASVAGGILLEMAKLIFLLTVIILDMALLGLT